MSSARARRAAGSGKETGGSVRAGVSNPWADGRERMTVKSRANTALKGILQVAQELGYDTSSPSSVTTTQQHQRRQSTESKSGDELQKSVRELREAKRRLLHLEQELKSREEDTQTFDLRHHAQLEEPLLALARINARLQQCLLQKQDVLTALQKPSHSNGLPVETANQEHFVTLLKVRAFFPVSRKSLNF